MLSIDKNSFKRDYENKFVQLHGKELKEGTNQQKYEALGSLVKDYVTNMWIETNKEYKEEELKQNRAVSICRNHLSVIISIFTEYVIIRIALCCRK